MWRHTRVHLSASTRGKDRAAFQRWIIPAIGDEKRDVRRADLEAILASVTGAGRSSSTRVMVYQAFNLMMDHAVGEEGHDCRNAVADAAPNVDSASPSR